MALAETLDLLMFAVACVLLLAGFPVAFTLAGVALMFAGLGHMFGVFEVLRTVAAESCGSPVAVGCNPS